MVQPKEIEQLSIKYFGYLMTDFGMHHSNSNSAPFTHRVIFSNDVFDVNVAYGYRHDFLDIEIQKRNAPEKIFYSVALRHIMERKVPDFDYTRDYVDIMPKEIGLEKCFRRISAHFKNLATDFLREKEWFTWEEVMGYEYPNGQWETTITHYYNKNKEENDDIRN